MSNQPNKAVYVMTTIITGNNNNGKGVHATMLQERLQFRLDGRLLDWLKTYSQEIDSTPSELLRKILTTLKQKEQRSKRKATKRAEWDNDNQFTLF